MVERTLAARRRCAWPGWGQHPNAGSLRPAMGRDIWVCAVGVKTGCCYGCKRGRLALLANACECGCTAHQYSDGRHISHGFRRDSGSFGGCRNRRTIRAGLARAMEVDSCSGHRRAIPRLRRPHRLRLQHRCVLQWYCIIQCSRMGLVCGRICGQWSGHATTAAFRSIRLKRAPLEATWDAPCSPGRSYRFCISPWRYSALRRAFYILCRRGSTCPRLWHRAPFCRVRQTLRLKRTLARG